MSIFLVHNSNSTQKTLSKALNMDLHEPHFNRKWARGFIVSIHLCLHHLLKCLSWYHNKSKMITVRPLFEILYNFWLEQNIFFFSFSIKCLAERTLLSSTARSPCSILTILSWVATGYLYLLNYVKTVVFISLTI